MKDRFVDLLPDRWVRMNPATRIGIALLAAAGVAAYGQLFPLAAVIAVLALCCIVVGGNATD